MALPAKSLETLKTLEENVLPFASPKFKELYEYYTDEEKYQSLMSMRTRIRKQKKEEEAKANPILSSYKSLSPINVVPVKKAKQTEEEKKAYQAAYRAAHKERKEANTNYEDMEIDDLRNLREQMLRALGDIDAAIELKSEQIQNEIDRHQEIIEALKAKLVA